MKLEGQGTSKDLMLVISKQRKGASKRFMEDMSSEHLRKRKVSSMATVAKEEKRQMGEADNGHHRRDFVNHGSNSVDPQPLYEVDVFNPTLQIRKWRPER